MWEFQGNCMLRFLTPSQQAEAPEAPTAVIEGRKQQGIEVECLHQEPEKIGHYTVVAEDHRGLTGKLDKKNRKEMKDTEWEGLAWERRCTSNTRWERCINMRTGKSALRDFLIQRTRASHPQCHQFTVERVQWLVSSLENRVASFMNTATAFRINVMKSWMWMQFLAHRNLLLNKSGDIHIMNILQCSPIHKKYQGQMVRLESARK